MARKTRLVDCNPRWGTHYGERADRYITFDCPEGHANCHHTIPFTPMLDGTEWSTNMAVWNRVGTDFATLTIHPSIHRQPTPNNPCHMHVNLTNGTFEFSPDSG